MRALLALETAGVRPSVAALRGDAVLAHAVGPEGRSGAEALLPAIDRVLREAGLALADVEGLGVSVGPGSFTGLRVGVATAKGLAFGSALPVAAVSTLAAVAGRAPRAPRVLPLLDAQRGEVYAAGFGADGALPTPLAAGPREAVYTPEELAEALERAAPGESWTLLGPGLGICFERLASRLGTRVAAGSEEGPDAAAVGRLAQAALDRREGIAAAELVPRYVRRAEAEARRLGLR